MTAEEAVLTEQEAAVYDRQIRIWGADAQRRLSKASLLVVGLTGAVAEVCKNVVLAGVGCVTLLDDSPLHGGVAEANFLVPRSAATENEQSERTLSEICAESLQDFNPLVQISVAKGNLKDKPLTFFKDFGAVLMGRTPIDELIRVNDICRSHNPTIHFFTVDCRWGLARSFSDLGTHFYSLKGKPELDKETETFVSLKDALAAPWRSHPRKTSPVFYAFRVIEECEKKDCTQVGAADLPRLLEVRKKLAAEHGVSEAIVPEGMLQSMTQSGGAELAPAISIIGGLLGQEIVRSVSGKGRPVNNFFLFDSATPEARIARIGVP